MRIWAAVIVGVFGIAGVCRSEFKAGASSVDISPKEFPTIRNGGFLEVLWSRNADPLFARSLVMTDGKETIAISVVDSCMVPTDVCDAIKKIVSEKTGMRRDRILISATHTHSAPSAMYMCLGTRKDEKYTAYMIPIVAKGIIEAHQAMRPAKAGWGSVDAPEWTNCRRWIYRSDRMGGDPFGGRTVKAMMHPGYQNANTTGPAGPIDPELSVLSIVAAEDEKPIGALANYSMHYFGGGGGFSADYFGDVARKLEEAMGGGSVVGIMSQGTSGDLHWMDYSKPRRADLNRQKYSEGVAAVAVETLKKIDHRSDVTLAMAEERTVIGLRVPSKERLEWAKKLNEKRGDRRPKDRPEVYAEQAEWIDANPESEIVLQAVRIGDLGIAALPNEVYGITGLKLKAQSPLKATFNIELANGADGYIPPPEQHALGGYTTWPARTAGLEEGAEPKIVKTLLGLLEKVSGKERRPVSDSHGPYAEAVLKAEPIAYWRMDDFEGPVARNAGGKLGAKFEDGVAFYLPGVQRKGGAISTPPETPSPFSGERENRAVHFAGGRLTAEAPDLGKEYSVELWFWNSFPASARPVTGYLFSRGKDGDANAIGEHLGIGGTAEDISTGRLFFYTGNEVGTVTNGKTELAFRDWHHVVLTRKGKELRVYLDGELEIEAEADWTLGDEVKSLFIGGRCDNFANFEGKIDEVSVFDRALTADEVSVHFKAAGRTPPASKEANAEVKALDPNEAIKSIHVPKGYVVDLIASEPLVLDPVAFDWDTKGRLWVVEMADYPLGIGKENAAGGRVRVLEDRDGDGKMDHSSLFAEGLNFPNGILTWRDGVIVTAAPDVLFVRDGDGDGKADEREVLLTGLSEGNQQLRANGLRWGLDNWVYVAAGGHHGNYGVNTKIKSARAKTETLVGSRDFRFKPDTGVVEAQSGPSQFGRNRDDWGRWFGTQNSRPLWHYVFRDHYLKRNPHFAAPEGRVLLPAEVNPPIYPAKPPQKRFHNFNQAGRYTSACSGMIYRDVRLFPAGGINAFSCEPFHNLVQHIGLKPDGVSFTGERIGSKGEPDFFASSDRWCRPVMARTGPDGGLWIADMYRYMIEHPQWLPKKGKDELLPFYREGDDRGRIYRVRMAADPVKAPRDLEKEDVVDLLKSSNGWVRDKAQQMIFWSNERSAVPKLEKLFLESSAARTRLHALCALDGLGALPAELVSKALEDPHPGVRENALRLAESVGSAEVEASARALVDDPEPRVRFQLAFSLGEFSDSEENGVALAKILESELGDPHFEAAVLSSSLPHIKSLVKNLGGTAMAKLRPQLAEIALGQGDVEAFASMVRLGLDDRGGLVALLEILGRSGKSVGDLGDPDLAGAFQGKVDEARKLIGDESAPGDVRNAAASLLKHVKGEREKVVRFLSAKIGPALPPEEFELVLGMLAATGDPSVGGVLVDAWPSLVPTARGKAIDCLLSRKPWAERLLAAVEGKVVRNTDFEPVQRERLLKHPDKGIRGRAAKFLNAAGTSTRAEVVSKYRASLKLEGDPGRGLEVFKLACAVCHKRGADGDRDIGPDLVAVADHPPEKLLVNILDPNLDIQPGYHAYTCELKSGEQLFGVIGGENAASITLKLADGSSRAILRKDIESLKSPGTSLMPEGLEVAITEQQMADLIRYIRGRKK